MALKSHPVTPELMACMVDLKAALAKHQHLTAEQLLAVASQLVGNLTALQDQTKYTSDMVMTMVSENLMVGNRAAIDGLMDSKGSA